VNPSRGLSAALLCALLGASAAAHSGRGLASPAASPEAVSGVEVPSGKCAGRGGPAAAPILTGPAYDLRAHPLAPDALAEWGRAGYGVNASSSQLLSPSGRPVAAAEVERLSAPFDAAADTMTNGSWSALIFAGYRLQDDSCRLLDPERRTPLTRLETLDLERQIAGSRGSGALEELVAGLREADASKPPPPAVLKRMAELEGRGEFLPEDLRRALHDPSLSAGALRGRADGVYAKMMGAWEGSRDLKSLAEGALPPVAGFNVPAKRAGRIESWESVVGDGFSADMRGLFSRTAAGRELLSRFRDAKGGSDLPKMTVLKMSQRPNDAGYGGAAAVYDDSSRTIILSHWYVVSQILAGAPPAERAALGTRLADSRGLAEYLRAHPAQRAAVADRMDVTVFHELTHAWQYRRQALGVEMIRGNAPGGIVLAHEHEAFYAMYRYFHEKLMNDPGAALRSSDFHSYVAMINDPEKYRDQITRQYQAGIAGSTDFKTLEKVQAERRRVLGAPAGSGPAAWARALLERAGLARGDAALKRARDDEADKEKTYFRDEIPRMRGEAARKLPGYFVGVGRPDMALEILANVPESARGPVDRRPEFAAASAALLARRPASMSLEERLNAFGLLNLELRREKTSLPAPAAAAYGRDALDYAGRVADQARAVRDPAQRAALLGAARGWLGSVPPSAPGAAALKKRLNALGTAR